MKKKILSILITILALCTCMFTLTACGGNEPPHTHVYDKQVVNDTFKASDATCEDKAEYYYSCSCGEEGTETFKHGEKLGHAYGDWISIENGQHKKTCANDNSHTIIENCSGGTATCTEKATCKDCETEYGSKKSHSYTILKQSVTQHWYECTCGAYGTKDNHNPGASATENTDQKCTECGYVITHALGHVHTLHLTKVNAKTQSCIEEGNVEYYVCSCGKWFTNNTATTEITDKDSVIIEKDEHQHTILKKTATEHWWECSCGDKDGLEEHHGGNATCTEKAVCDDCETEYGSKKSHSYTILKQSATQHWHECTCGAYETKENHIPDAEATEKTDQKCTECGYVITPALGHVHTLHLTKVDAKPQSCTATGNSEYYTCSCGKWFTDNTATTEITDKSSVVIAKDDHEYEILEKSATQHWYKCTCGAYETKDNHKGGTATCKQKATCSVCDTVYGNYAEHSPKQEWIITDTHHYHECVYGCTEKLNYQEHSFTDYVSDKNATYESDGTKTANCNGGCGKTHTITDVGSMLIKDEIRFTTLNVDGKNVTGIVSNSTEKFYFADEIFISGKANFIVSLDEDGIQSSITKSMPLAEGDNTFYVLETLNGVYNQTYVITIHRNYMFAVNFMVDGEAIKTEQIEENQQVTAPIVQDKYGYTFDGWQTNNSFVSFPYTITKNTTFTAVYTPIPYYVTYHMDTYDSDGVITSKTETVVYTIEDMDNGVYALKNTIIDDYVFYGWTTEKQFEPENTITSVNELNDYIFYSYYEYGTKGVVYEKAGETYAVTGYQGNDSDFIIAVLHNGLPVTTINPSALKDNLTVESITISKYISNIGLFAFNGCKNVTQVYYAADNCQDLAEDTRAFYYLGQNKSGVTVTVADNVQRIPEHLFFAWILDTTKTYHPKLKTIQFEDNAVCQEISKRAFGWCFEITSIEIPESVKTIGKEAFSKLYYVENIYFNAIGCGDVAVTDKVFEDLAKHNDGVVITVGKNVTTIPSGMFNGLGGTTTNIKDIYFATNGALTSIGSGAFAGAKKLTKVEIPETIQNVELSAFMYCSSLTEFAVPKSVKVLYLSGCTSLQEITFNSVIEELYVDSCSSLINVTLPNTLKKVDFSHCTSIETLELPDGVTSAMFTGCSKLGTMTLPAGFTEVADNMFKDCSFLKGVEFEGEVTRIGDYAFSNCAMLGGSLPSSVKYIGAHAYEYTAKTMFSASYNLETIGEYAFRGCSKLYYVSIDIKTISKYAFYNCTTLDTLYIDFGVENIEEYAFYNTGITSIELPISVKKLGSNAFNYENFDLILENKVNPSEFLYSTYYSSDTTYGNNNITSNNYSYVIYNGEAYITKYSGSENSVTIPTEIDGYPVVALVGTYCGNSYINEVYIPESITWIDYDAFYNCNNITAFYLYADNKPDNWHDSWNHNKTPYWDYQGAVSENGFDFLIIGEEAYIVGYNGAETDLSVPNKFNDKTVKGFMGDVFNGNTTIRTIFIPETFVELPDKLFYNCTSLTGIALDNIITIGKEAFYGCTSLKEIILSSALINIGDNAFYNCSIETVTAPTIALPFFNNGNLKTVVINGGKEIPESAFYNCESLTSVVIPNSVTSIGAEAFSWCTSLTSIEIPNSVTSIGKSAFRFCVLLTSIIIPNSVKNIDAYAFDECESLSNVVIPDSVKIIGSSAFRYCDLITKVNYTGTTDEWVQIEFVSYDSNPLYYAKKLYINNELVTEAKITTATKINKYAFYSCDSLTSVEIGDSVTSIGDYAFNNCSSLTSIEIPDSVISIGAAAFRYCDLITKVNYTGTTDEWVQIEFVSYNSNPTYYAKNLYINDNLITKIEILTAKKVSDFAFYNCKDVKEIYISSNVSEIGLAFRGCSSLEKITIPFIGRRANDYLYYSVFGYIFGAIGSDSTTKIDGAIYQYHNEGYYGTINYQYYHYFIPESLRTVVVLDGNIPKQAFNNCSMLTDIIIPDNVNFIGKSAFSGCTNLRYNIKNGIKYLGNENNKYVYLAGVESKDLETVSIEQGCRFIGDNAFNNCDNIENVVIPNHIKSIGYSAFRDCDKLQNITIAANVSTIGESAFNGCNSLLNITVDEKNGYYKSFNGDLYNKNGDTLIQYAIGKTNNEFTILDTVTSITIFAFYESKNLKYIVFEDKYTWYRINTEEDWIGKVNGTKISVTNSYTNATNLVGPYGYYWYKK